MFSRIAEEATRTSSGMRGTGAGTEPVLFDATQAPHRRSMRSSPGAAALSSVVVCAGVSAFGWMAMAVSGLGSGSMIW